MRFFVTFGFAFVTFVFALAVLHQLLDECLSYFTRQSQIAIDQGTIIQNRFSGV